MKVKIFRSKIQFKCEKNKFNLNDQTYVYTKSKNIKIFKQMINLKTFELHIFDTDSKNYLYFYLFPIGWLIFFTFLQKVLVQIFFFWINKVKVIVIVNTS